MSIVFENDLPTPFCDGNCSLSVAHCLGRLTACAVNFLDAKLSWIFRTRFCFSDCFFRNHLLAGDVVIRHWNKYFVQVSSVTSAHHDPS